MKMRVLVTGSIKGSNQNFRDKGNIIILRALTTVAIKG
jgi:hypothetical protein